MNIYIDESGSFVSAQSSGHWNCVAAYMSPELDRKKLRMALRRLKQTQHAALPKHEIKLREIDERDYFDFLNRLVPLRGVLFAVAVDAGIQSLDEVKVHQLGQAEKIEEHKDKMHFDTGRQGLIDFADQIRSIAPQLYVQLICHAKLIFTVVNLGVLYFVQRVPNSLGTFRWRIDQKNAEKNIFEDSYLKLALPLLQSFSMTQPLHMLEGADYRRFRRFDFAPGKRPTYLEDDYGLDVGDVFDLRKLLRENLKFDDSLVNDGIQVSDLLASGLRRCLRGGFNDNRTAAGLLGSLMVQEIRDLPPLKLICFGEGEDPNVDPAAAEAIAIMTRARRNMVLSE